MRCPACGAVLSENLKYCSSCSQRISEKVTHKEDESERERFYDGILSKFLVVLCVFAMFCVVLGIGKGNYISAIVAFLVAVLTVIVFLMGVGVIATPKKYIRYIVVGLACIFMLIFFCTYNTVYETDDKIMWEKSGIWELIPQPYSDNGRVVCDPEHRLEVDVYHVSQEQFEAYINACKDVGYIVEGKRIPGFYSAFHRKGYLVNISYDEYSGIMSVCLESPDDAVSEDIVENTLQTNGDKERKVYITPSGSKYHYDKNCAGKNAGEATVDENSDRYSACKKCTGKKY